MLLQVNHLADDYLRQFEGLVEGQRMYFQGRGE